LPIRILIDESNFYGPDLLEIFTIFNQSTDALIEVFQEVPHSYDFISVGCDMAVARNIVFDWKFKDTVDDLDLIRDIGLAHIREIAGPEQIPRKKDLVFWEIDNDIPGCMGVSIIRQFDRFSPKVQFKFMVESDMGEGYGDRLLLKDFFNRRFPV
jgi:hypothetical protein